MSERRRDIEVTRQSTSEELAKDTTPGGIASVMVGVEETSGREVKGGGIIHEVTITTDKSNGISKNDTRHGVYPRVVGCHKDPFTSSKARKKNSRTGRDEHHS